MEKEDFFKVLIEKGNLIESGLDKSFKSYRLFGYKGKKFKLETLVPIFKKYGLRDQGVWKIKLNTY